MTAGHPEGIHEWPFQRVREYLQSLDPYTWAGLGNADLAELEVRASNPDDWVNVTEMVIARPTSVVFSMRLNRHESRVLSEAARFHGEKLSTYIKRVAMAEASRPQVKWNVSASGKGVAS